MPITGLIPQPKSFIDSFMDQVKDQQKNKLRQAQIQESLGKGAQSSMIANLLGQAFGSPNDSEQNTSSNGMSSSSSPTNRQQQAKSILQAFGIIKETPDEAEARTVRESQAKTQGETDIKSSDKLEDEAMAVKQSYGVWKQLQDLLVKNPHLTGILSGAAANLNLSSDPDLGAFNEAATTKLGEMAKQLSQRGGAAAASLAQGGKPSAYKSPEYNMGMINSGMENHRQKFKMINDLYKKKTGKDLNFGLEDDYQSEYDPNPPLAPGVKPPQIREPSNESQVQGQSPPPGNVWMIRPDNVKVPVHKENVDVAKSQYKYRDVG